VTGDREERHYALGERQGEREMNNVENRLEARGYRREGNSDG
jgi:hypothetical protein